MRTRTTLFPDECTEISFLDDPTDPDMCFLEIGPTLDRVTVLAPREFFDRMYETLGEGK